MHWQYWPLAVTIPAGTPQAAPLVTAWPLASARLSSVEIDMPAGHNGLAGIRLLYHGTQVFPWAAGTWLVPVRASYDVTWEDDVMPVGLTVQSYNLDAYPHTAYLRARVWPVPDAARPAGPAAAWVTPPGPGVLAGLGGQHAAAGGG